MGISFFNLGFGASSSTTQTSQQAYFSEEIFGETYMKTTTYSTTLSSNYSSYLDSRFQQDMNNLPLHYTTQEEKQKYMIFLAKYGTHFLAYALFGGVANMWTNMRRTMAESYSSFDLQSQLNAKFYIFTGQHGSGSSGQSLDAYFDGNSMSSLHLLGGNTSAYLPSEWNAWVHTVYYDPVPVESKILPLSVLCQNSTQKSLLNQAINDYLNYAAQTHCDSNLFSGHGTCSSNMTVCKCNTGYTGDHCEINLSTVPVFHCISEYESSIFD